LCPDGLLHSPDGHRWSVDGRIVGGVNNYAQVYAGYRYPTPKFDMETLSEKEHRMKEV